MISFQCGNCGKTHSAKPELAGKVGKCPCGYKIMIPAATATSAITVPAPMATACPRCQYPVQPPGKACVNCGTPLASPNLTPSRAQFPAQPYQGAFGQTAPKTTDSQGIHVGDESIAKINVNQSVNVAGGNSIPGGLGGIPGQGKSPVIPSLAIGDGSVVKANIDASQNFNMSGDIVKNKSTNYTTHNNTTHNNTTTTTTTNITNNESGIGSIISAITNSRKDSKIEAKEERNLVEQEFKVAANSVDELIAFVAKQTALINSNPQGNPEILANRYAVTLQAIELLATKQPNTKAVIEKNKKARSALEVAFNNSKPITLKGVIKKGFKFTIYGFILMFILPSVILIGSITYLFMSIPSWVSKGYQEAAEINDKVNKENAKALASFSSTNSSLRSTAEDMISGLNKTTDSITKKTMEDYNRRNPDVLMGSETGISGLPKPNVSIFDKNPIKPNSFSSKSDPMKSKASAVGDNLSGSDGFTQLFNGKDLTGWKTHPADNANWEVVDGVIKGSGKRGHLFSVRDDFSNFIFRVEAKISDKGNSGLCFRARYGGGIIRGLEAQINSTGYDKNKTGSLYAGPIAIVKVTDILVPPDTWFTQEITAQGNHIIIKVNDTVTVDTKLPPQSEDLPKGHLAIQQESVGTVWFRKLEVKKLN